jgi:2-C-methyl-D-erythritol 4-phosphate cytidylyltransferase
MRIWAIVPAAGIGHRFGSMIPKQYLNICGAPVLLHSINCLLRFDEFVKVIVVLHPDDKYWDDLDLGSSRVETVIGGDERVDSVLNGLKMLEGIAEANDWVAVHDAVRPCLSYQDLRKLISELQNEEVGGLLASPIVDTLKKVNNRLEIMKTVDRDQIWSAMTPQIFRYSLLKEAISRQKKLRTPATDEAGAIEAIGLKPRIVQGEKTNIKITDATDLALVEQIILSQARA